ncbi:uncharacterized protein MYCFIDRAFT_181806 [Pseudocercospora fijiensis CIRAD86]|uniref:Uncharacterized protein n=1 Tax=Pseudocercospora fijiensis (strain CIRAD86) TaxID=383855 RepID=M3B9E7_PSEFD|nr:uncharacterized protein MYCFIDRAFT_181806 [Pseudocercospora fijiensis CIRAD86]EME85883.1 hypothetical protein MYCFIDRAFT_181806 [Pseudocercospora fijiensis CIRAD86]
MNALDGQHPVNGWRTWSSISQPFVLMMNHSSPSTTHPCAKKIFAALVLLSFEMA